MIFIYEKKNSENSAEDAETEVALNLICVDDTTRQTLDIPIRPRSVKEMKHEVHRKQIRAMDLKFDSESKNKSRLERSDTSVKTGNKKSL